MVKIFRNKHRLIQLSGTSFEGVPEEIQVLPFGRVESKKGPFLADEQAYREVIDNFNSEKNDVVIDYEHQTLYGVEAPAAGWIKELVGKGKQGLWAKVEWTPRAKEYLANKEYRYFSPVLWKRKSDNRAAVLHSAALTNTPAVDGMVPVVNKLGEGDEDKMDFREMVLKALGLAEDATDEQVSAAIKKAKDEAAAAEGLKGLTAFKQDVLKTLELGENATEDQVRGKIVALKNPSGYVPVEQFNDLKKRLDLRDRDDLVQMALNSGKVAPAQKTWAEEYALKDPAGFKAFLAHAPVVVPVNTNVAGSGRPAQSAGGGPDDVQLSVNKALGIDDDTYKKYYGGEK